MRSRGRLRRPRRHSTAQAAASLSARPGTGTSFTAADFDANNGLADFDFDGNNDVAYDENGPSVIFNWSDTAGSELGTLSLACLSEWDATTFPQVSAMYPESLMSETPRSVTAKSAYFASRVGLLPSSQSNRLIVSANHMLGQKLRLLDPVVPDKNNLLQSLDRARPSTTTNAVGGAGGGTSHGRQRLQASEDMRELLRRVKVLRGIADPSEGQASRKKSEDALQKKLQARERAQSNAPTRQPGDMRGLSARVRVDMKVTKYRDPSQLHALRRSLGQIKAPADTKKDKKEGDEDNDAEESGDQAGRQRGGSSGSSSGRRGLAGLAVVQTPRTMADCLLDRAHVREERMRRASAQRKVLIQQELEHFYATSSAFKDARVQQAKNDRLSSRKVTRGWIKISWAYLSGVHFRRTLIEARANRAEAKAMYMAQVRISSQYRRRKGLEEFRARQRADYILKTGLKRVARRFKKRRKRSSANMLLGWLRQTQAFSRRVLGYLMLKKSAIAVQRTWRNFRAIKEHQIRALSYKMKSLADDAHQYAIRRHLQSGSKNKLPPMEPIPPWDIQYEILGAIMRPVRRSWQDRTLPKYQLDRAIFLAKRLRYARQREQDALERRGMSKKPGIDLGALLMEPSRPRFDAGAEVDDDKLLKAWNDSAHMAKFPKKWQQRRDDVQKWLAQRKANHYYVGRGRRAAAESGVC